MSYNTKEELLELSTQKLLSYLGTLIAYKTKIFMKPGEKPGEFKIRKDAHKESNAEYFKNLPTKLNELKKEERINTILELEKMDTIGELPKDINYKNLLETEKEVGNILVGIKADGKRKALDAVENTPDERKEYIHTLIGHRPSAQATATSQTPAPETAIQKQAQSAVGADPNTIIDKPQRGRPKKLSKTQVKEVADDLIILGYKNRLHELEKLKPEDVSEKDLEDMRQLEIILSYRMYKKTVKVKNPLAGEEYLSRIKKLVGKKEGTMVNPTDPMLGVFADKAMREQPPPRQIATVEAEPTPQEQKEEHEVKAQPQQQVQQQMPQSPQSPKLPPKISNILGGAKQPAPAQPQAVVANVPATISGDKSIGDVRQIGLAPYTELAKADEVLPPKTERQKSLELFANFNWRERGATNNSILADLSPFQRIDDIEYNLRYGKTFKLIAKIPVQRYYKPYMAKQCENLFTKPEYVPNDKVLAIMQPSTPIGFALSTQKNRNVLINEEGFDNKDNMEFLPKYTDRPKKNNPFSACHGLESYYPNEMIMPPIDDPLQKSSVIFHPDTSQLFYT
jgi:hypothetical protein